MGCMSSKEKAPSSKAGATKGASGVRPPLPTIIIVF